MEHWAKRLIVGFRKYGLLAKLQAIMSQDSRFLLFLHHNYQVSLNLMGILLVLRQIAKNTLKVEMEYVRSFLANY